MRRVWLNVRQELWPASWAQPGVRWDDKYEEPWPDGELVDLPDDLADRAVNAYQTFIAVGEELKARRGEAVSVPEVYEVDDDG